MKLKVRYETKERRYVSDMCYQHVSRDIEAEPVMFIRYPCGTGAAANRYYYQFFFLAPDDAAFTEKLDGKVVCRENVDRNINKQFNPKSIVWTKNDSGWERGVYKPT